MPMTGTLPAALAELSARAQWVVWRREPRDGKPTKVPYNARTGALASSTDRATWSTYEEARGRAWQFDGVGYVLSADDPYVGIDLDHCRDAASGELAEWARIIVDSLASYTEVSPSNEGLRVFVRAALPPHGRRKGALEMYAQARFLTITGAHLVGTPTTIEERQHAIDVLHARTFGKSSPTTRRAGAPRAPNDLDDGRLLEVAFSARNGDDVRALWNGDWSGRYTSPSEADLALCSYLAFYAGPDEARIDSLFRQSGLYREKWDREDYRRRTIDRVLSTLTDTYTPPGPRLAGAGEQSRNGVAHDVAGVVSGVGYPVVQIARAVSDAERAKPQLIEGLVWKGRVHWAFSDPAAGKTLFAEALGLHIAAGEPFLGREVEQGSVLMIEEDSPVVTAVEYAELLAEIYNLDLPSLPFYINSTQGLRLTDKDGIALAKAAIDACPVTPTYVIFDAMERLVPSEKFTSREIDHFDQFLRWLTNRGITPQVLDHTNRSGRADPKAKGKQQTKPEPMDLMYGGRSKSAISDVLLYFGGTLRNGGTVEAEWPKWRVGGGAPPPKFRLRFDDEDGFSLVVTPGDITSKSQRIVLSCLRKHADWSSQKEVTEETQLAERTVQRALAGLVASHWVAVRGETVSRRWRPIDLPMAAFEIPE